MKSRIETILSLEARSLDRQEISEIRDEVVGAALEHDIDPLFILALMRTESGFDPRATSSQGALGLLQIQPTTARWFAEYVGRPWEADASLFDLGANIRIGVGYFAYLYRRFGDLRLSLHAYQRGPTAVRRAGIGPGDYPHRVFHQYRRYRTISACETAACPANEGWAVIGEKTDMAAACLDAATFCG